MSSACASNLEYASGRILPFFSVCVACHPFRSAATNFVTTPKPLSRGQQEYTPRVRDTLHACHACHRCRCRWSISSSIGTTAVTVTCFCTLGPRAGLSRGRAISGMRGDDASFGFGLVISMGGKVFGGFDPTIYESDARLHARCRAGQWRGVEHAETTLYLQDYAGATCGRVDWSTTSSAVDARRSHFLLELVYPADDNTSYATC